MYKFSMRKYFEMYLVVMLNVLIYSEIPIQGFQITAFITIATALVVGTMGGIYLTYPGAWELAYASKGILHLTAKPILLAAKIMCVPNKETQ